MIKLHEVCDVSFVFNEITKMYILKTDVSEQMGKTDSLKHVGRQT